MAPNSFDISSAANEFPFENSYHHTVDDAAAFPCGKENSAADNTICLQHVQIL